MFVNPGVDDLRLQAGSPCIDTASIPLLPADWSDLNDNMVGGEALPLDLDLTARIKGEGLDMGAYEQ